MRRAWAGKHVLITGASQGIGRAVALAFANKGAHLHLIARNVDALRKVQDQVRMQRSSAEIYPGDVAKTEALVAQLRAIDHACGGLDLVIANAGRTFATRSTPTFVALPQRSLRCCLRWCAANGATSLSSVRFLPMALCLQLPPIAVRRRE
jgi:NAD(P)-dependent dehydrogenase (short-subunit alcohol dehydrogenase family)